MIAIPLGELELLAWCGLSVGWLHAAPAAVFPMEYGRRWRVVLLRSLMIGVRRWSGEPVADGLGDGSGEVGWNQIQERKLMNNNVGIWNYWVCRRLSKLTDLNLNARSGINSDRFTSRLSSKNDVTGVFSNAQTTRHYNNALWYGCMYLLYDLVKMLLFFLLNKKI